jgi:hypothetical protein
LESPFHDATSLPIHPPCPRGPFTLGDCPAGNRGEFGFFHTFDPCAPFVIGGVESGHQSSSSILQGLEAGTAKQAQA